MEVFEYIYQFRKQPAFGAKFNVVPLTLGR